MLFTQENHDILRNPYYKGCVTTPAGTKQSLLISCGSKCKQHGGGKKKRDSVISSAFLKGIIRCDYCDVPMLPTCCVKNGLRYRYYTCSNHKKYKACKSEYKSVPAGPVEEQVVNEIIRILKSPEILVHINKLTEENKEITREEVLTAIKNLNEVWSYLYQAEQRKIVKLLINSTRIRDNGLKLNLNGRPESSVTRSGLMEEKMESLQ